MANMFDADKDGFDAFYSLKIFLGVCLVAGAVLAYSWVFVSVYKIFSNPQNIAPFKQIFPATEEGVRIEIENNDLVLPESVVNFMAYLVAIFLLLIAVKIGGEMLSKGFYLLIPPKKPQSKQN
ncbi:hypothetical protein JXA84_04205 [candidate division WOR-3 bacterium]|nr:hypothetical protein [candidate division WOR-3 bacterium]